MAYFIEKIFEKISQQNPGSESRFTNRKNPNSACE